MKPKPLYSTPTSAMIEALSTMGMTTKEAAGFVLADNGSIPRAYADDLSHRSTLTKRFKQARPGSLTSNDFDDFTVSVPRLLRELLSQRHVAPPEGGARSAQVAGGLLDQLIGEPGRPWSGRSRTTPLRRTSSPARSTTHLRPRCLRD